MSRKRSYLLGGLALLAVAYGTCAVRNASWHRQAEAAVDHAVQFAGARVPDSGFVIQIPEAALAAWLDQPRSIEVLTADNFLSGTSLADVLGPGVFVAEIRTGIGQDVHAEAVPDTGDTWLVSLHPEKHRP